MSVVYVNCKGCNQVFIADENFVKPNVPVCIMGKCNLEIIDEKEALEKCQSKLEK